MSEVIIKGEVHSSRGDFREERDILAEGVDILVIEGSKEETELSWLHGWFGVAMMIFEYLFASFLYTDHQTLVDIAKGQEANVVYTRETDAVLIKNSHKIVVGTAFVLFYSLIFLSALLGFLGHHVYGAVTLLMAGLGPIIILRIYETKKSGNNRDKKIAKKIEEAAADGGRVVAVMGNSHAKNVPGYLPEEMDPDVREPNYGFFSVSMGRDLFVPAVRMVGMMGVVYPAFLMIFEVYFAFI
ncbi:hypothetical protein [Halosolutus halophilus]|uniref:hypothetical protein n=1 Tax=Halosolutus halophilus TaxID=1552990 RepID=UPI002235115A|nr:hypothetical protein [Halosolutus halophilus]